MKNTYAILFFFIHQYCVFFSYKKQYKKIKFQENIIKRIKRFLRKSSIHFITSGKNKLFIRYYSICNMSYAMRRNRITEIQSILALSRNYPDTHQLIKIYKAEKMMHGFLNFGFSIESEYVPETLLSYKRKYKRITEQFLCNFLSDMQQLFNTVHHDKQHPIAFIDLSPSNIGVYRDGENYYFKILDFDSVNLLKNTKSKKKISRFCAYRGFSGVFTAPEIIESIKTGVFEASAKADIFSLGAIIQFLLNNETNQNDEFDQPDQLHTQSVWQKRINQFCHPVPQLRPDI